MCRIVWKKLVERFRSDDLQIDYYTVSKILNKNNYTLFKGKFHKVLVESEVEKEPVIVEPEKEAVLFSLVCTYIVNPNKTKLNCKILSATQVLCVADFLLSSCA